MRHQGQEPSTGSLAARSLAHSGAIATGGPQEFEALWRDNDDGPVVRKVQSFDQPSSVGLLPHGKARAGCPPGVQHICVGTRCGTQSLKKIKDQIIDSAAHAMLEADVSLLTACDTILAWSTPLHCLNGRSAERRRRSAGSRPSVADERPRIDQGEPRPPAACPHR